VLDHLEKNKIDNTLILTGDIHQVGTCTAALATPALLPAALARLR